MAIGASRRPRPVPPPAAARAGATGHRQRPAWRRWSALLDAAERAAAGAAEEPFEPTVGRAGSMLVNVPALIAIRRSFLAQLRGDAEGGAAFASRALAELRRGRVAAELHRPGFLAMAEWLRGRLAEAERAFVSSLAGWQAAGQPTLTAWDRVPARPGPAGPGPPGRGHPDLRAGAGSHRRARPAAAADRRPRLRGPGRGGLPAERTRQRPPVCHRGHRAEPPVPLRAHRWPRPGDAGVDPAGHRRSGRSAGGDRRSRAGLAGAARPAPPGPGPAARLLLAQGDLAAAARWTHENGLRADDEPATLGSRDTWCWPGCCWPGAARRGARAAGPAARRGGRPGPDRQRHRGRRAAGPGPGRLRPGRRRGGRPGRRARAGLPAGLCPGLRRRGPADGRAAGPADRGPAAGRPAASVPLGYLARLRSAFGAEPAAPAPPPR